MKLWYFSITHRPTITCTSISCTSGTLLSVSTISLVETFFWTTSSAIFRVKETSIKSKLWPRSSDWVLTSIKLTSNTRAANLVLSSVRTISSRKNQLWISRSHSKMVQKTVTRNFQKCSTKLKKEKLVMSLKWWEVSQTFFRALLRPVITALLSGFK